MKKIFSFILLFFLGFFTSTINILAGTDTFTYNYLQLISGNYALVGSLDISDTLAYGIEIYIPFDSRHEFSINSDESYISFSDANNNILYSVDFSEISGADIGGWYIFDFENLEISDVASSTIIIMSNAGSSLPSGTNLFTSQMDSGTQIVYNYDFEYNINWSFISVATSKYVLRSITSLVTDAKSVTFYIPYSEYHRDDFLGLRAKVYFSNDNGSTFPYSYNISDFNFSDISGIVDISLLEIYDDEGITTDFTTIKIEIPQDLSPPLPPDYIEYLNENSYITFNNNIYSYRFYVDGVLFTGGFFRNVIPLPTNPTKAGYIFNGWITNNGAEYSDGSIVNFDLLINNNLDLYASWREGNPIDTTLNQGSANNILSALFATINMDTNLGYVIVYLALIMIILFYFAKFSIPPIMTIITMLLLTSFWIFLGFLPVLMAIMSFITLLYMLINNIRGGASE